MYREFPLSQAVLKPFRVESQGPCSLPISKFRNGSFVSWKVPKLESWLRDNRAPARLPHGTGPPTRGASVSTRLPRGFPGLWSDPTPQSAAIPKAALCLLPSNRRWLHRPLNQVATPCLSGPDRATRPQPPHLLYLPNFPQLLPKADSHFKISSPDVTIHTHTHACVCTHANLHTTHITHCTHTSPMYSHSYINTLRHPYNTVLHTRPYPHTPEHKHASYTAINITSSAYLSLFCTSGHFLFVY